MTSAMRTETHRRLSHPPRRVRELVAVSDATAERNPFTDSA